MVRHDDAAIDVKDALAIADKLSEIQRQIKECHDQYESCAQDLNCVNQEGHHE
jgi:archaellum component FlaC